jgi:hypothetical protein
MKISKIHKKFASYLESQKVLTHPEKYLGTNWEAIINFWLYLDTLTEDKLKVVRGRYYDLSDEVLIIAHVKAWNSVVDIAEHCGIAGRSAYYSVSWANNAASNAARNATYELIGLQKLLEQGHQPLFFPMFLNL